MAQVKKQVVELKTGAVSEQTQYGISTLSAGHWEIENRLIQVKDDSFGEDRHVLQSRHLGGVMVPIRATDLNLLHGGCVRWKDEEPLPGRLQRVYARPLLHFGAHKRTVHAIVCP